jgi:hypothetical protein
MSDLNPNRSNELQFYTTGAITSANPVADKTVSITQLGNVVNVEFPDFTGTTADSDLLVFVGDGSAENDALFKRILPRSNQLLPVVAVNNNGAVNGGVIIQAAQPGFGYFEFIVSRSITGSNFTNGQTGGLVETSFTYLAARMEGRDYRD